jgi:hypothetical protein
MSKYLLLISFALSGCLSIEGDKVAYIYPKEGIANIRQFSNSCPVKVTKPITVNINNLNGWICIPSESAAKYRREFERDCD